MRNWGTVVTGFYILIVAALSPIFGLIAEHIGARPWFDDLHYIDWRRIAIWCGWTALLGGGPLVLFLVGVDTTRKRLRPRRHIFVSAAAAGFTLALLVLVAASSVLWAVPHNILGAASLWGLLAIRLGSWLLWALVLWRLGERLFDPAERVYRWLIVGSVLELLIAVPSHVIVRQRNECTAPSATGMGAATGLAILLMSLGPGALFLYRARMRRISARRVPAEGQSDA